MFEGTVYYHKSHKYLGCLIAGMSIVFLPVTCLVLPVEETNQDGFKLAMLFAALIIAGMLLAIGYARFKIEVKEQGLIITSMFGKTRKVRYERITRAKYSGPAKTLVLMEGERRLISVENYAIGYQELCELCREKGIFKSC